MKKLFLLLTLFAAIQLRAGSIATVPLTNSTLRIPSDILASNAVAIANALQGIGFSGGTNAGNMFDQTIFSTNGSGQVTIIKLSAQSLTNVVAVTNLPGSIPAVAGNLDPGLTNTAGKTVAQQIRDATNAINSASLAGAFATAFLRSNTVGLVDALTNSGYQLPLMLTNGNASDVTLGGAFANDGPVSLNGGLLTLDDTGLLAIQALTNASGVFGIDEAGNLFANGASLGDVVMDSLTLGGLGGFTAGSDGGLSVSNLNTYGNSTTGGTNTAGWFVGNGAGLTALNAGNLSSGTVSFARLPGALITNGGVASNLQFNTTVFGSSNTLAGSWITTSSVISGLNSGNNSSLPIGTNSVFYLSGPSAAFAISGLAGGIDGREITLINDTGQSLTVLNNSGVEPGSSSTNRIITGTGSDLTASLNPWVLRLRYNGAVARWVVMSGQSSATVPYGLLTNAAASAFTFGAISAHDNATNYWLDFNGAVYQKIIATGNICFRSATNGPGALSVKVWPNGSDRTLLWPTNFITMNTNGLTLAGTNWSLVLTNGPRVAWISVVADTSNSLNTNLVFQCVITP